MSSRVLKQYGRFAARNPEVVISVAVIFTLFMAVNALSLEIETDFEKTLPENLPSVQNLKLLRDKFAEPETYFILVVLNEDELFEHGITDIRDLRLMEDVHVLEEALRQKPAIQNVFGPPDVLIQALGALPEDQHIANAVFAEAAGVVSIDYTATVVFIETKIGNDDEHILEFVADIEREIAGVGFPGSVKLTVTGGGFVQTTIFSLLFSDLYRTLSFAALLILLVLVLAYRSAVKGISAVVLLGFAVIWTGGTMKLLAIPLSIITVVVGSLIIGIGIDYTIHIINRFKEEKQKGVSDERAAGISVSRVGWAILGTSVTTIVSFMAQTAAGVPLLTQMGIALSLGIFYAMVASIFVLPSLIVVDEKFSPELKRMLYGTKNS